MRPIGIVERQERGHHAIGRDLEDRPVILRAAVLGGAVQVTITTLHETTDGVSSVTATREGVQPGRRAIRRDLENRAGVVLAAA